jgi:hypothetical protein
MNGRSSRNLAKLTDGEQTMSKKNYTPNEKRSRSKNPRDPWGKAALDNYSNQLNPNNERYQGNRESSPRRPSDAKSSKSD